ncbi:MAG TPA: glycosyltransferase family 9 protein [Balneolaceae bacterium]
MREKTIKDLNIKKIGIFRALQLGDLLNVIPSMRALRKKFPKAEVTLIGLPWAKSFVRRFNKYFDNFIEFPGFPGLPERAFNPQAFVQFLSRTQQENFDLAIQMQGSGSISNRIMELLDAKNIAGFYTEEGYKPNNQFFIPYPETGHEAEKFLKLMEGLGIKAEGTDLEFPVLEAEAEEAARLLADHNLQEREFVCIHTGSREDARRWNADNFAKTADYIHSKGYKIVFTGTEKERESIHKIAKMTKSPSVNLAGCTRIGELAQILKESALLVSNDTGVVHIATAIGAKSVIIYSKKGSNLERWAPIDRKTHSVVEPERAKQVDNVLKEVDLKLRAESPQRMKREYEHAKAI